MFGAPFYLAPGAANAGIATAATRSAITVNSTT